MVHRDNHADSRFHIELLPRSTGKASFRSWPFFAVAQDLPSQKVFLLQWKASDRINGSSLDFNLIRVRHYLDKYIVFALVRQCKIQHGMLRLIGFHLISV